VDKTRYLVNLIDSGSAYFLSRPRRFGKSLTVSTFDALFSGKRELFKGLDAEEFFDRSHAKYRPHPVVRLDMSRVTTDMDDDVLRGSILAQLRENADRLRVRVLSASASAPSPGDALDGLIRGTAAKWDAPVVVLIDEYDMPVLNRLHFTARGEPKKANAAREILKDLYLRVKAADEYLRFVFMTGISKFSRMGVFSALNNLKDISMKDEYAAMLGYTQEELLSNFAAHIDAAAARLEESRESLAARIRDYYDGFSFDGRTRLYNPFSTLNFFDDMTFKNYWFESGTPSYLTDYVKRRNLEAENFRGLEVAEDFADASEIENAPPESFLFQSGYLSIRERRDRNFILDYPNMEVLSSVARLFLHEKFEISDTGAAANNLEKALKDGKAEELVKIYNSLLASLPYDIYTREERQYSWENGKKAVPRRAESFYHAVLFSLLWSSRIRTSAENHTYWGRSDIEAEKNGHRYVIELKIADGKEAAEKAADEAMTQILAKGYADKYALGKESAILIGLAVDRTARQVGGCRIDWGRGPQTLQC
jgi:hypothetical protein